MTTFTLTIDCDNAAFQDGAFGTELNACLHRVIDQVSGRGEHVGAIRDTYGATVGRFELSDPDDHGPGCDGPNNCTCITGVARTRATVLVSVAGDTVVKVSILPDHEDPDLWEGDESILAVVAKTTWAPLVSLPASVVWEG